MDVVKTRVFSELSANVISVCENSLQHPFIKARGHPHTGAAEGPAGRDGALKSLSCVILQVRLSLLLLACEATIGPWLSMSESPGRLEKTQTWGSNPRNF